MGRKHKSNSIKYINKCLKQENASLQQMTNYMSLRNAEIQKKNLELESYNNGIMEILKIQKAANQQQKIEILETNLSLLNEHDDYDNKSEFSRNLSLACSIKTSKISPIMTAEISNKISEIE